MKVAVLSDIHGNLEALQAVAEDLVQQGELKVVCLGDLIGYGPDPEEVVNFVRRKHYEAVLGNHEFALGDARGRRWLNFLAAENNALAEKALSPENLRYCTELPAALQYAGGYFVHGFPPESVFRYLHRQSDQKILELFKRKTADIYFLGHTHKLQLVVADKTVDRMALAEGDLQLDPEKSYIVNCGSVGQPRDKDSRAKYIIWDPVTYRLEVHCVVYDKKETIRKIRQLGLPEAYAMRLR